MNITIYTKPGCPNCDAAKKLMQARGLDYDSFDIEKTPSAAVFLAEKHPVARQMPQIFIDDQRVGGLAGLQAALKQLGL